MTHTTQTRVLALTLALLTFVVDVQAQEKRRPTKEDVQSNEDHSLNRIGLSYRAGFNVSVKFKNVGGFAPTNPNNRDTHGNTDPNYQTDQYDDGWNKIDSENDQHPDHPNTTWFWGYNNSSQHQFREIGETVVEGIEMHSSSTSPTSPSALDSDMQNGFELTYSRELGRNSKLRWGIEGGFGFENLHVRDNRTLSSSVTRTNDFYALPPGVSPPPAPYPGTFTGDPSNPNPPGGPLLGDIPMRTVDFNVGTATTTGFRQLDADVIGFRVGPYVEFPLTKKVAVSLSAGLAVAEVNGEFSYSQTVSMPTIGKTSPTQTFRGTHSELLAGVYIAANVSYEVCRRARIFGGLQWEDLGSYKQGSGGSGSPSVEADFSQAVYIVVGVGVNF